MSHFSVLVIGPDHEKQLAPFHEFECTGDDNEFVQDIDKTQEARDLFAERTETRLKAPDGTLHSYFDENGAWRPEFSQPKKDSISPILTRHEKFVPPGYEEIEVPASEVETFAKFAADYYGWETVPFGQEPNKAGDHKYGYITVDEAGEVVKCIDRTNPNKKWDWYAVGGRWSGFFQLKPDTDGVRGEAGLMGSSRNKGQGFADQTTKGAIDFDAMRTAVAKKAGEKWDKAFAAAEPHGGLKWEPWVKVREEMFKGDIDGARTFYNAQPIVMALQAALDHPWDGVDEYLTPRDQYAQEAADRVAAPYALVVNGEWVSKGEMGWFGMSADAVSQAEWNKKVNDLIAGLPDDTQLTLVDCHI